MMRWLALSLVLLAVPALAQDEQPKPDYYGVWKGTIGTYPVMACVDQDGYGKARGAYYYMSRLTPIGLAGSDAGADWNEQVDYDETGARWRSIAVKGAKLSGSWTDGKKSLPISLERQVYQTKDEYDGPCMGDAFLTPRLAGGKVIAAEVPEAKGAWRKLTYVPGKQFGDNVSMESFSLTSEAPGDKAINAALAQDIDDHTFRAEFLQCLGFEVANSGTDGYYGLTSEPDLITRRWVNVSDSYENSCGGAHPNAWYSFRTFDRQSGAQVNLFRWFNDKAVEHVAGDQPQYDSDQVLPPLRDLALRHTPDDAEGADEECPDATRDTEFWFIGLAKEGLQMTPSLPHVIQACAATYVVPWGELDPYLSKEGKAGVAALKAD